MSPIQLVFSVRLQAGVLCCVCVAIVGCFSAPPVERPQQAYSHGTAKPLLKALENKLDGRLGEYAKSDSAIAIAVDESLHPLQQIDSLKSQYESQVGCEPLLVLSASGTHYFCLAPATSPQVERSVLLVDPLGHLYEIARWSQIPGPKQIVAACSSTLAPRTSPTDVIAKNCLLTIAVGSTGCEAKGVIQLQNPFSYPLTIDKVYASCGCVSLQNHCRELLPHEACDLPLTVSVTSSPMQLQDISLSLSGADERFDFNIPVLAVRSEPLRPITRAVDFGTLRPGASATHSVMLQLESPIEIKRISIQCDDPWLTAKIKSEDFNRGDATSVSPVLHLDLNVPDTAVTVEHSLKLLLSIDGHSSAIPIYYKCKILPDLHIEPAMVYSELNSHRAVRLYARANRSVGLPKTRSTTDFCSSEVTQITATEFEINCNISDGALPGRHVLQVASLVGDKESVSEVVFNLLPPADDSSSR